MYFVKIGGTGGRVASGLQRRKMSVFWMLWIAGEYESSMWKKSVGSLRASRTLLSGHPHYDGRTSHALTRSHQADRLS